MLSIGNKKYRNLQEQVGFNTEQIEKIFDVLDGLAVTDNVVAIADLSDNLNADQLEIVQKSVAFLVYDGQLYIKKSEDASNAYFDIVFTISSSGGVISFNSKEIEVVLATGALSQTISTNSTYSSSQIDSLLSAKADITYVDTQLALKANLAGANFTGDITAPSIIENMSGYSFSPVGTPVNTTREFVYAGVVKNGNKLTLVVALNLTNTTGTQDSAVNIGKFAIPSAVMQKLYPVQIGVYNFLAISKAQLYATHNADPLNINIACEKGTSTIEFTAWKIDNLVQNTKYYLRFEFTFLLSDNLAS